MLSPVSSIAVLLFAHLVASGQNATSAPTKPTEHVLGTITAADPGSRTVTVKEDKTDTQYAISLENTRTLLRVEPGAKDLKSATRITVGDLAVGDRVDVRGFKLETSPNSLSAASVILMSGRDIQQARQAEMADWRRRGLAGVAVSVDSTNHDMKIRTRTLEGPQIVTVNVPDEAKLSRYSPETPNAPLPSRLEAIQTGDEVRVLGKKTQDGAAITAEKIYSGSFRTVAGTVTAVSPQGNQIIVTDLQTKQPVQVDLTPDSAVRRLPPEMAAMLARRLNPNARPDQRSPARPDRPGTAKSGPPSLGAKAGEQGGSDIGRPPNWTPSGARPADASAGSGAGDISQWIERLPKISVSELKSGDAVVVSGAASNDKSKLIATNIIAGVEPIFQSAPPRQGRSLAEDWNLDISVPNQ